MSDIAQRRKIAHAGPVGLERVRVMRRSVRQRVTGIVVNEKVNVAREDYDRLKASLYNCVRRGPASQNHAGHDDYQAHLAGRVAHVAALNAQRGQRLRELFDRIAW